MKWFLILLLLCAATASAQNEAVTINTKTKNIVNPLVIWGAGKTIECDGCTKIGFGSGAGGVTSITCTPPLVCTPDPIVATGAISLGDISASLILHSSGDSNDPVTYPYTYLNSGIIVKDVNNDEVFRIWATDPITDWSLYIGDHAGANSIEYSHGAQAQTAIGHDALRYVTTGSDNVAVGTHTGGSSLITGQNDVFIGNLSVANQDVTASIAIGDSSSVGGDHAVAIGWQAQAGTSIADNAIAIGSQTFALDANTAHIGNASITDLYAGEGNAILHGLGVIPAGGTTGQLLTKVDSTDYNVNWDTLTDDFGFTTDARPGTVTTGVATYRTVRYAGTITGWNITVIGSSPTCTIDVWKIATGTALPTVTNTITASAKPALSTGNAKRSSTLTAWTTTFAAGDIFGFNIDAASNCDEIIFELETTK